jgi:hypothetical protein
MPTSCKTDGSGGKKISQDSNWRKGSFLHPFLPSGDQGCKGGFATCQNSTQSLAELFTKYRIKTGLTQGTLAAKLGVGLGTIKN